MKKNKLMVVSNDLGYGAVKMSVDGQYIKELQQAIQLFLVNNLILIQVEEKLIPI